jgi:hypothetical protein
MSYRVAWQIFTHVSDDRAALPGMELLQNRMPFAQATSLSISGVWNRERLSKADESFNPTCFDTILYLLFVCLWSQFLATDPEVPGSILGATRFSEK